MAALVFKIAAFAVFLVAAAVGVSAQTHHVVGGWGPDLDVTSWLSGRLFTVGDKIWFKNSGIEDTIVEVSGLEEFISCNLTNPIKMYTDPLNHVVLDKEGTRYFTSGNPDMCKNGLKLPVPVNSEPGHSFPPYDPSFDPGQITPPFDPPYDPPSPPFEPFPPYDPPSPPFEPYPPVKPTPPTPPHEPPPVQPSPPHKPPPSAAPAQFTVVPLVVSAGLLVCYCLGI